MSDALADRPAGSAPGSADGKVVYRAWHSPADWTAIAEVMSEQNAADDLEFEPEPDELAAEHRPNSDPAQDILLAEARGVVVGVVLCSWAVRDGRVALATDGAVRPAARRQGIGTALLHRAQARLDRATRDVDPGRERILTSWVGDSQVGARALLARDGYRVVRYSFDMVRRGLTSLSDADLGAVPPAGIAIRPATFQDLPAILAAEDEAFRDHPGHRPLTDADRESVVRNPYFDPALWRVAWAGDEVAGVVTTTVYRGENERLGLSRGWLERVSVRRPWRKRGVASALIVDTFRALRDRGIVEACLGVDADNPSGALRLYEGLGFERLRSGRMYVRDAPR